MPPKLLEALLVGRVPGAVIVDSRSSDRGVFRSWYMIIFMLMYFSATSCTMTEGVLRSCASVSQSTKNYRQRGARRRGANVFRSAAMEPASSDARASAKAPL